MVNEAAADGEVIRDLTAWLDEMREFRALRHLPADIKVELHDHRRSLGLWRPTRRAISIHAVLCFWGPKAEVAKTLCHEACHASRTEPPTEDCHDDAWRGRMWSCGLSPNSHAIIPGSAFAEWWSRRAITAP